MSRTRPSRAEQEHSDLRWRIIDLIAGEPWTEWASGAGTISSRVRQIRTQSGGLNGTASLFPEGTLIRPQDDLIVRLRPELSCLDADDQISDEEVELLVWGLERNGARVLYYDSTIITDELSYLLPLLGRTRRRHQAIWIDWCGSESRKKRWLKKIRSTYSRVMVRDQMGQRVPGSCKVVRYALPEPRRVKDKKTGRTRTLFTARDKTLRDDMLAARNGDPEFLRTCIQFFEQVKPFEPEAKKTRRRKVEEKTSKTTSNVTVDKVLNLRPRIEGMSDNLRSPLIYLAFGTMRQAGLDVEDAVREWKAGRPALSEFTSEWQVRRDWERCARKSFARKLNDQVGDEYYASLEMVLEQLPEITRSEIAPRVMIVLHHVQRIIGEINIGHHAIAELAGCCPKTITNMMRLYEEQGLIVPVGPRIRPGMGKVAQKWKLITQRESTYTQEVQPPLLPFDGSRGRVILERFWSLEGSKIDPWYRLHDGRTLLQSKVDGDEVPEAVVEAARRARSDRQLVRKRAQQAYYEWLERKPRRVRAWRDQREWDPELDVALGRKRAQLYQMVLDRESALPIAA